MHTYVFTYTAGRSTTGYPGVAAGARTGAVRGQREKTERQTSRGRSALGGRRSGECWLLMVDSDAITVQQLVNWWLI